MSLIMAFRRRISCQSAQRAADPCPSAALICTAVLADVCTARTAQVIPNEYGIQPEDKLSVGSKVCRELLGKLLADMANMREESIVTAGSWEQTGESVGLKRLPFGRRDAQTQASFHKTIV